MAQYVTQSGTIMVELDRALYVCIESARLWFDELLSTLKSMGLVGFLRSNRERVGIFFFLVVFFVVLGRSNQSDKNEKPKTRFRFWFLHFFRPIGSIIDVKNKSTFLFLNSMHPSNW